MQNKLEWDQSAALITKTTEYRNTRSHLLFLYFICMKGVQLQVWGKVFWRGNLKERDNLEDLALDGMIVLKPRIKLITYGTENNKLLSSCVMCTVWFLHVSATVVAILREMYLQRIYYESFKSMYSWKYLVLKTYDLKCILNYNIQIKFLWFIEVFNDRM